MARNTQIIVTSDVSGQQMSLDDTVVMTVIIEGERWSLDMTTAEMQTFKDQYLKNINPEKVGKTKKVGPDAKTVRAWAESQGIDVPKRGRMPATVIEAFEAAH